MQIEVGSDWKQFKNVLAKAKVFINGNLLNSYEFAQYVHRMDMNDLDMELSKINGFFSFIKEEKNKCIIVSDRVGSETLFYTNNNDFYVTDNPSKMNLAKMPYDDLARLELLLSGCVSGSDTLFHEIKQTQAGEIITFFDGKIHARYYFKLKPVINAGETLSINGLLDEHFHVLTGIFQRLINYADGRTIVIPLSGGYDSRLVATMLKKLNYNQVITFTFGRAENGESIISKQVANDLGYPWIFIPYTNESNYNMYSSSEYMEYKKYSDTLSSIYQDRDWPAVWELTAKDLIPKDAIFVPGHSGDFLAAIKKRENWNMDDEFNAEIVVDAILDMSYVMWNWSENFLRKNYELYEKLLAQMKTDNIATYYDAISALKQWEFYHMQVKYIIHSVKVYEFWGYDWWMPFWDKEYIDFWSNIPYPLLADRKLYSQSVAQLYSEISGRSLKESFIRATGNNISIPNNHKKLLRNLIIKAPFNGMIRHVIYNLRKKGFVQQKDELRDNDWEQGFGRLSKVTYEQLQPYITGRSSCKTLERLNYIRYSDTGVDSEVIKMLKDLTG